MTSKRLTGFAKKNGYPFLCVHSDKETRNYQDGSVELLSLKQSALSFPMDVGLKYDPFFQRHTSKVMRKLVEFKPDIMHITGLNDVSIMGSYLSWKLNIPMIGSWHTNLHEFAASRLGRLFSFLPKKSLDKFTTFAERKILDGALLYYKMPKIVLAPNRELMEMLEKGTGREAYLMVRGVDTELFNPVKRTVSDGTIRIGFVGRLRAEKNVRLLQKLEAELAKRSKKKFEFLIVGDGNEKEWLQQNMKHAVFTGFIEGESLSEAFERAGLTTPVSARFMRVGEHSGRLGEMLNRSARYYDGEISRWIERFTRTFEPLLMVAIGVIVGLIVVLLYMPIFDLAGSFQ